MRRSHRKTANYWRQFRLAGNLIAVVFLLCLPARAQEGDGSDSPSPGSAAPDRDIEEILVRGQAGQGIGTESAVSVTAFDSSDLQAMGVGSVEDIARFTPGLEIRSASATTPIFFIRGVGLNDFTANAAGAVAIYVDGVALDLPAIQNTPIFDVESVEVLRGPQGYGPGRNASAGAIKVYTQKPTGTQEGYIRFDYGNFNYIDTEGALETPILGDILSTRLAFRLTQRDGIMKNRCAGAPPFEDRPQGGYCHEENDTNGYPFDVPARLNNQNRWAARGLLRFLPPESNSEWLLGVHGSKVDQLGTVGQTIGVEPFFGGSSTNPNYRQPEIDSELDSINNARCGGSFPGNEGIDFGCGVTGNLGEAPVRSDFPSGGPGGVAFRAARRAYADDKEDFLGDSRATLTENLSNRPLDTKPFEGDYNIAGYERLEAYGGFLRGDWELGNTNLRSISGYETYDRELRADYDYSPKVILQFASEDEAWQFTEDIEWSGELEDTPLGWSTGGYFLAGHLDWRGNTEPGGDRKRVIQEYVQKTWSFGIYGDFDWQFLDDFTLSGGVRYNWERKEFDAKEIKRNLTDRCAPDSPGHPNPNPIECDDQATFSAPTGSINLDYAFNDEVTVYWRYTHGWKGPQYTIGSGLTPNSNTLAKPEEIDSLEWGFKSSWLDDRLQINGSLFWYDYANYQVFLFENNFGSAPVRKVINANAARLYGAELDATIEPIDRLIATLRFGWLESHFLDFTDTGAVKVPFSLNPVRFAVYSRTFDYTGNRLPNTPRFKLSGSVEYTFELGRFGSIRPRYDFSWTDDIFFDPSEGRGAPNNQNEIYMPKYAVGQKAYWLHDVGLTYTTPDDRIEVAAWVRNIADEVYKVGAFDVSVGVGMVNSLVGDPRTYGLSLRVNF